jgi:hypothetical protein
MGHLSFLSKVIAITLALPGQNPAKQVRRPTLEPAKWTHYLRVISTLSFGRAGAWMVDCESPRSGWLYVSVKGGYHT